MKSHWENIYSTKADNEVSWYQEEPKTSLELINKYAVQNSANVLDVGGGNSNVVIRLHEQGFSNLNVLDISGKALQRTQQKLGDKSGYINWIESSVLEASPKDIDVWHDRAVFHFLTKAEDIQRYIEVLKNALTPSGIFILATFSTSGPLKCSGLEITQYDMDKIHQTFGEHFEVLEHFEEAHTTPFDTEQAFQFVILKPRG